MYSHTDSDKRISRSPTLSESLAHRKGDQLTGLVTGIETGQMLPPAVYLLLLFPYVTIPQSCGSFTRKIILVSISFSF